MAENDQLELTLLQFPLEPATPPEFTSVGYGIKVTIVFLQGKWQVLVWDLDGEIPRPWYPGAAPVHKWVHLDEFLKHLEKLFGIR